MFRFSFQPLLRRDTFARVLIGGAGLATIGAFQPTAAAAVIAQVTSLVTCATGTACVAGSDTSLGSAGIGVAGTSTNGTGVSATSMKGIGLKAASAQNIGIDAVSATDVGILGTSSGQYTFGVVGAAAYGGVRGYSTSSAGGGFGVKGQAEGNGDGVYGITQTGHGVFGYSYDGGAGVWGGSVTGIGVRADISGNGFSVVGTSDNLLGNGADFEGGRFGIIGRALPAGFPLVLTDNSYNNVFYVSGTGNVYYSGSLQPFSRTAAGSVISAYTPKSAQPTVEDVGTAQLVGGVATVTLDPTFAATVDASTPYHVFLTPNGDTRGLFVAQKTPRGFIVRETQGGRSTLAFDYRIIATSRGQVGQRMTIAPAAAMPNTPRAPLATQMPPKMPTFPSVDPSVRAKHPALAP